MLKILKSNEVNENADGAVPVSDLESTIVNTPDHQPLGGIEAAVTVTTADVLLEPTDIPEGINTADDRFIEIIELYKGLGYSCAFTGNGFIINHPSYDNLYRIICRDLNEGFRLNILGSYLSTYEVYLIVDKLSAVHSVLYRSNIILNQIIDDNE